MAAFTLIFLLGRSHAGQVNTDEKGALDRDIEVGDCRREASASTGRLFSSHQVEACRGV